MKKVLEAGSDVCWDSRMFRSAEARMPVTAWTMPGRSGQLRVRMWSAGVRVE